MRCRAGADDSNDGFQGCQHAGGLFGRKFDAGAALASLGDRHPGFHAAGRRFDGDSGEEGAISAAAEESERLHGIGAEPTGKLDGQAGEAEDGVAHLGIPVQDGSRLERMF